MSLLEPIIRQLRLALELTLAKGADHFIWEGHVMTVEVAKEILSILEGKRK